jgi:carbonic anhydrase
MHSLIAINKREDILPQYLDTPIGDLIEYHNLNKEKPVYNQAEILVGMCMDNRKHLNIPDNFAYIIRAGGANLQFSEFNLSYAIAVGQVHHIVVIGHNKCGMVNLIARKDQYINDLIINAGWTKSKATESFNHFAPIFEIGNEIEFTVSEVNRLRLKYPKITLAPLLYNVDDNRLYLINED